MKIVCLKSDNWELVDETQSKKKSNTRMGQTAKLFLNIFVVACLEHRKGLTKTHFWDEVGILVHTE